MSCQRVNYVPSKCHRVLDEPHPIKPRRTRVCVYIPASLWPLGHPTSWIYLHWSAVSAFFISLVVVFGRAKVCPSLRYFIYIDGTGRVCLFFHAVFIARELAYERWIRPVANDPFVLARKSLEFNKMASWAARAREMRIAYMSYPESESIGPFQEKERGTEFALNVKLDL